MIIKKSFIDPVLEEIERSFQKARLRRRIRRSIRGKKRFFKNHLKEGFTLYELPLQQRTIKGQLDDNIKGKAKEALSEHVQSTIQRSKQLNDQFKEFTRYF